MPEIVVVGSLKARPGKEADTAEALGALVAPTHAEDGCILYALHQGVADPTRFAFIERWDSQEHLDAHFGTEHMATALARVDELLSEPPDIVVYNALPGGEPAKGSLARHAGG